VKTRRAICFDGGGICGLLSLVIFERLLSHRPSLLAEVDLYAGTSTGGIISLGLAGGVPAERLHKLYHEKGAAIFKRDWLHLLGLLGAKYRNSGLRHELEELFGDRTLGDLDKLVLVPAFDLRGNGGSWKGWHPKFFSNWNKGDEDFEAGVVDVAMATSAAPTYFPSWGHFADGGMTRNNPSTSAMSLLLNPRAAGYRPRREDLRVLSIGTGAPVRRVKRANMGWGALQWMTKGDLLDIFMYGSNETATYDCKSILQDNYCRINPQFDPGVLPEMDQWKRAGELVKLGEGCDIEGVLQWLDQRWGKPGE